MLTMLMNKTFIDTITVSAGFTIPNTKRAYEHIRALCDQNGYDIAITERNRLTQNVLISACFDVDIYGMCQNNEWCFYTFCDMLNTSFMYKETHRDSVKAKRRL